MGLYERIILADIEFSDSQSVDQALWKNVFYQVIERFRQLLKDPSCDNTHDIRNMLLTLLDEVRNFGKGQVKNPHCSLTRQWGVKCYIAMNFNNCVLQLIKTKNAISQNNFNLHNLLTLTLVGNESSVVENHYIRCW